MRSLFYILMLLIVLSIGCGRRNSIAEALDGVESLCDADPQLAVSMLDSLDTLPMSRSQRHRFGLLSVKSRDKAYIRHTSDSLILDAIDYYSGHRKEGLYPEALYYGGRVYSDLGDLPTAIGYFQQALDEIPDTEEQLEFKGTVLSQTGRLLNNIGLYSQALPYIEKSRDISRHQGDSMAVVYDNILLISIHSETDALEEAKKCLTEANAYSNSIPDEDKAWLKAKQASILCREARIDSALKMIRPLPDAVDSLCLNYVMNVAMKIYLRAGIRDTAYMYAHRLAVSKILNNRINGFRTLFSEEIHPLIPDDSIRSLVEEFSLLIDEYLDRYEADDAVIRNSRYNYDLHLRERLKAEKGRLRIIWLAMAVTAILVIMVLFFWVRRLQAEIRLRIAIEVVNRIISGIKTDYGLPSHSAPRREAAHKQVDSPSKSEVRLLPGRSRQHILKLELLERLQSITDPTANPPAIDKSLLESKEMKCLKNAIADNQPIPMKSRLWLDIERSVHVSAPGFKDNLMMLSYGGMTKGEYQVALLSRFGLKPKDMATLLGRSKQAVSDRRSSLALKIFEQPRKTDALDTLILRL